MTVNHVRAASRAGLSHLPILFVRTFYIYARTCTRRALYRRHGKTLVIARSHMDMVRSFGSDSEMIFTLFNFLSLFFNELLTTPLLSTTTCSDAGFPRKGG